MRRTGCSEFGGDAASDEIRRKGFRHDARKSFAEKKAGGIFFGERECERAVVGRNKQQVASCALRRDKGRQRMMWATWLAEEGFTVLERYFGSRYLKAWEAWENMVLRRWKWLEVGGSGAAGTESTSPFLGSRRACFGRGGGEPLRGKARARQ